MQHFQKTTDPPEIFKVSFLSKEDLMFGNDVLMDLMFGNEVIMDLMWIKSHAVL